MIELMMDQYLYAGFKYEKVMTLLKRLIGSEVSLRTQHRLLRL